jgi:prepilin-type N-terminal cleavage/methylation domain-containing protein
MKLSNKSGFTLIEIAMVLIIVGLLLTTLLTPLTAQIEQSRNAEARRDMLEIKDALTGFAIINGRLPCPDTNADANGTEDVCVPNTFNTTDSSGGNVPWETLNTKQLDPWGRRYQYRVNNAFTTNFILSTAGAGTGLIRVCTSSACTNTEATNVPLVIYSTGQNGAVLPPLSLDEQANIDGNKDFVSHDFSNANGGFDDIVMWMSTNILMNKMVSVGKLP